MRKFKITSTVFCVLLLITGCYALWPADWEEAEIESKWVTDSETYQLLVDDFIEDSEKYGYKMNVRWDGIPKKYVDFYYDNQDKTLSNSGHVFRHRMRFSSKPEAKSADLETLRASRWREDWSKIQYKNSSTIVSPVWFRVEVGACRVTDRKDKDLCVDELGNTIDANQVIYGEASTHPAVIAALETDTEFDFQSMEAILKVEDYRYRVEFLDDTGEAVYELSLDRATITDLVTDTQKDLIEVELEVLIEDKTREDVESLFALSYQLQQEYNLTPSTENKGAVTEQP